MWTHFREKICSYKLLLVLAFLSCFVPLKSSFSVEGAGYAPDAIIPMVEKESYADLASRVLPAEAQLLINPQAIDFGADKQGILLIFSLSQPAKQYHIWYLAPQHTKSVYHRIVVKDGEPLDEFYDIQVNHCFTIGPDGAKDLVLLETYSRPAIAGGDQYFGGDVYRRSGLNATHLEQASKALDGVTSKAQAIGVLKPWIVKIPSAKNPKIVDYFLNVPIDYLNATKLERWELVKPGSSRLLVRDIRNGYLQIAGDGGLPGYVFSIFMTREKKPIIAFQTTFTEGQSTLFLNPEEPGWQDISKRILPDYKVWKDYQIPHVGTDLAVRSPDGDIESVYQWNRERFVLKKDSNTK
ncbi:MAG: hypothetical protein P8179_09030 [Candidatus Thiodiazotropha sp.]